MIAALELVQRLHEPFAKRRRPDDERAIVILKGAGHDFRRRCRSAVDEHNERNAQREVAPGRSQDFDRLIARPDADDLLTIAQEKARRRERLFNDTTPVITHVEHEALGTVFHQNVDGGLNLVGGIFVERLQRDVSDVIAEHTRVGHGGNVHDPARQTELDRLGNPRTRIGHQHLRTGLAAQQVGDFGKLDVCDRRGID